MIFGIFWFLVANAAVLLGAHAILGHVRTSQASVNVVVFLLIRLVLISTSVLVAGLTHTLTPIGLGLMGSGALAALLAGGAHKRLPRPRLPEVGPLIGIFAALVALRLVLQVWFFSPHLGDALAYHLPKIAEWVRAGSFTREMGLHPHATFPAGFELVETWWVVFFRHDVFIEMAGVEFLILAFAGTYALSKSLNLTDSRACFAALLYVLIPGLYLSATSCLNDAPVAALVVATAALIVGRVPLPLVVMTIGLGIGVKPTYGFTLPGMALLSWLMMRELGRPAWRSPQAGFVLGGLGLAIGSFWYARNLVWFGNPFHPLGTPGFVNPVAVQFGPRLSSLPENAIDLVNVRIYDNLGAYGANVDNIGGWGGAAFACGLLALSIGLRTDVRLQRLTAAFALSLASALLFVQHDPWCLKYVFFFPAILSIATARLSKINRGVAYIGSAALALSFVGTMLPYDLPIKDFRVLARQSWRERSAAKICQANAPGDAIGCFGGYKANSYLLYGPNFSRRVAYLRASTADDLLDSMKRTGVRLLYAVPGSNEQREVLTECSRRGLLTALGERFYELR
jgi:hypothetical protein